MSEKMVKLQISPIYGWGWHDSKTVALDVPDPFDLSASIFEENRINADFRTALGQVEVKTHPLFSLWILLTQRHGNAYNLMAFKERPDLQSLSKSTPDVTGFVCHGLRINP